ncbi:hypothetical protein RJT34_04765 [Clitoria ternatea]|uniref:BHLH domain-containing protein n=1 Tax=Clitoria ternatea TaxID=43366 RepID=A0AAN9KP66_CLITE
MAEFTPDWQSFRLSFPFLDIDNMELTNQFKGVVPFPCDTFLGSPEELDQFPGNLGENFLGLVQCVNHHAVPVSSAENEIRDGKKKRKAREMCEPSSENSIPDVSERGSKIKYCSKKGKRVKKNVTEDKKPSEVVHVRAKRGQATDSHSLAERVRRGKINEKLKCLQNIVPGCYKTMGMAIMLDEIINYVQSLQHQVEFLSMRLTAASTFYDFNSETDALETMQVPTTKYFIALGF